MHKPQLLRIALMVVWGLVLFLAGYGLSQLVGYAKIARMIEPTAPLVKGALSGMSEQEVKDTMDQIRQNAGRIVQEQDLQSFFEALSAKQALGLREQKDDAAAWSYLEQRIAAFRERYKSREMQIGDWKPAAESLYLNTGGKDE